MLTWKDDGRFDLGGTIFQTMPADYFERGLKFNEEDFFVFKSRSEVDRYAALIDELKPQRIFELGIYGGGSTLFFAELARPQRIVAIDQLPLKQVLRRVGSHAAARGLEDVVRTFGGVDQADRPRIAQIAEDASDGASFDLVIDDCSHMYEPTRASFNELFPRLRPGGLFIMEDWRWAYAPLDDSSQAWAPVEVPLSRLVCEILLAIPSKPGLISEVSVMMDAAVITRGEAEVDLSTFEISECSDPAGRALLATNAGG